VQRIVAATDFSRDANEAIRVATTLAKEIGSELVLLYVDKPLLASARSNETLIRRQKALTSLERVRRAIESEGVSTQALLKVGSPAKEIIAVAAAEPTRFVVMGTRGHSPVVAALLGGVAYDVVRKAPCPVLTARAPRVGSARAARKKRGRRTGRSA
jgi:nucleotide-binding universal stress UspA family protein